MGSLVSVDFFVVPTVMFKVLFVFVVLAHERRRVVHCNVTDAPTAQWTAQQLVEAFPWRRPRATSCATAIRSTESCSRAEPRPWDPRSQDGASLPLAEFIPGTPHRDPAPRVPRPHGGVACCATTSSTTPQCPNAPLPRQGRPGAETRGAPRPGRHRPDTHGRRPASSVHTPGGVRSFRPAGVPVSLKSPVGWSVRFASLFLRLASEPPHGARWSMLGLLRSQGPVRLTTGRSRSSEYPDGLSGRRRITRRISRNHSRRFLGRAPGGTLPRRPCTRASGWRA
jgi:hypothetical protein